MVRWLLLIMLLVACSESPEASQTQSIAAETDCRWQLIVATEAGATAFEHSFGPGQPFGAWPSPPLAVAGDAEGTLFSAHEEGVIERRRDGDTDVLLDGPAHALAYDRARERLYVARPSEIVAIDRGGLPFSLAAADAAALAVGAFGHLYAASGAAVQRIDAETAEAELFTSSAWGRVKGMTIGVDGSLYLVDGGDTVFVVDNPELPLGEILPTKRVAIRQGDPALAAVLVAPDGIGYLADGAGFVHAVAEISDAYPFAVPEGSRPAASPRALALLPPCDGW